MANSPGNLRLLLVALSGNWESRAVPRLDGKTHTIRTWTGTATSSEPIVAAVVIRRGRFSSWGKSEFRDTDCVIQLTISPFADDELEIAINVVVGHGGFRRAKSQVQTPDYIPLIPNEQVVTSGQRHQFAVIEGDRNVEIDVIFLAQSDVTTGRTGNWRLRPERSIDEELTDLVNGPKSGQKLA